MKRVGRHKGGTAAGGPQSWRQLQPARSKGAVRSSKTRLRRWQRARRVGGVAAAAAAIVALGVWGARQLGSGGEAPRLAPPSREIEKIFYQTDGVLPRGWLAERIEIRAGTRLMDAKIHALKRRLEQAGQVRSASVERVFPNALRIVLKERAPVLRMVVETPSRERSLRIVGRDGTVYRGTGYTDAALRHLPYLDPYRKPDGSIFPLRGIERVAELLDRARRDHAEAYRRWRVVSLERYSGDLELPGQIIEVRSTRVPEIFFDATGDFGRQLDRLAYLLDYVRDRGNPGLKRVDLALEDAAAVRFRGEPPRR